MAPVVLSAARLHIRNATVGFSAMHLIVCDAEG